MSGPAVSTPISRRSHLTGFRVSRKHRFFSSLGIDDSYFQNTSVDEIVSHIISLYGSKVQAYARADHKLNINLEKETEKSAVRLAVRHGKVPIRLTSPHATCSSTSTPAHRDKPIPMDRMSSRESMKSTSTSRLPRKLIDSRPTVHLATRLRVWLTVSNPHQLQAS